MIRRSSWRSASCSNRAATTRARSRLWRASQVQGFDGRDDALEGVRASYYAALKQPWGFYADQARLLLRHAMLDTPVACTCVSLSNYIT